MSHRLFTLEEARAILPQVRLLVGRCHEILERVQAFGPQVKEFAEQAAHNSGGGAGTLYVEYLIVLQSYVSKIQGLGCLVKDLEAGLIDFPHLREGREVYLCWKQGEDDIQYWHEVDAGFAGRTRLEEDS
jgi:hypothetical protein